MTDTYIYDAFGVEVAKTETTTNPFGYQGELGYYTDQETGILDVRRRPYEPKIRRWCTVDPLESSDGTNRYVYAQNNPLSFSDPTGTISIVPLRDNLDVYAKCKDTAWIHWDFFLDRKAPCKGYLIQKITITCDIVNCPCSAPSRPPGLPPPAATYYEIWPVSKDEVLTDYRFPPTNSTYTDASTIPALNNTCGYFIMEGEVRFYCENAADDPRPPNKRVGTGPVQKTTNITVSACGQQVTSGGLSGSTKPPGVWQHDPLEGPASRYHGRLWACCNCVPIVDRSTARPRASR